MAARSGQRACIAVLALSAVLLTSVPRAWSGRCIGADRARVVRLFEYLHFKVTQKLNAGNHHIRALVINLLDYTNRIAPVLAMEMIRLETRWTMRRLLTEENFSIGKMTAVLQAQVKRVQLILSPAGDSFSVPSEELKKTTALVAGTLAVCRAVRQKKPEICEALDPPDRGGLRRRCESMALHVLLLYKNDCSNEFIRIMASAWNKPPAVMKSYCIAAREQKPQKCDGIPGDSPAWRAICRIMSGQGRSACQDPALSEDASRDCQNQFYLQETLAGRIEPEAIPRELKERELVWPALLAALSDIACDDLALDTYEEKAESLNLFNHNF